MTPQEAFIDGFRSELLKDESPEALQKSAEVCAAVASSRGLPEWLRKAAEEEAEAPPLSFAGAGRPTLIGAGIGAGAGLLSGLASGDERRRRSWLLRALGLGVAGATFGAGYQAYRNWQQHQPEPRPETPAPDAPAE